MLVYIDYEHNPFYSVTVDLVDESIYSIRYSTTYTYMSYTHTCTEAIDSYQTSIFGAESDYGTNQL